MIFPRFFSDHNKLFWVLHLSGWLFWGLVMKYLYTTQLVDEVVPHYLWYVLTITAIAMLISLAMRYVYRWVFGRKVWLQALVFLLTTTASAYVWMRCRAWIYSGYVEPEEEYAQWLEKFGEAAEIYESVAYLSTFSSGWTLMAAWSVLYFGIKYHREFQAVRERALKSAAMAHEAQLKMLRYQLNPHFLFNTLNAISTLVLEKDWQLANEMVSRLSRFLRFSLDNDPLQKISLDDELEAIGLYLGIEKVRFEERLIIEHDIEPEAHNALIPSLLLQPLVENSIKYGIAHSEQGGTLRIAARVFADELLLEISDNGPGCELVDGCIPGITGVGLRNTRERLKELYGHNHGFNLSRNQPHGLTINIRIPLEK